jgi:DNA repair protein RadC
MDNIHKGHRERLKQRFLNGDTLQDHELLELLLFFAIPRGDTNEIAHLLINKCGGFDEVFKADISLLSDTQGVGNNTALLLKLIVPILQREQELGLKKTNQADFTHLPEYFIPKFIGETNEKVMVCAMNEDLNILGCGVVSSGSINLAPVNVSNIVKFAYSYNTPYIALAHNHPNGSLDVSEEDVSTTRFLANTLRPVNVILLDHIIVCGNDAVSLKFSGKMYYI